VTSQDWSTGPRIQEPRNLFNRPRSHSRILASIVQSSARLSSFPLSRRLSGIRSLKVVFPIKRRPVIAADLDCCRKGDRASCNPPVPSTALPQGCGASHWSIAAALHLDPGISASNLGIPSNLEANLRLFNPSDADSRLKTQEPGCTVCTKRLLLVSCYFSGRRTAASRIASSSGSQETTLFSKKDKAKRNSRASSAPDPMQ
jgi:hypothetical protein